MMRIFICPNCRTFHFISRPRKYNCPKCGTPMILSDISYIDFAEMDIESRAEYIKEFLSSHG